MSFARSAPGLIVLAFIAGCTADEPVDSAGGPLPGEETVTVYYNSEGFGDGDAACGMVVPVPRSVPVSPDPVETALVQLFAGPTTQERAAGYYSWFSAATRRAVRSIEITDNTVYVDLEDIRDLVPGASSSCGSESFLAQIEETVWDVLPEHRVVLAIEGEPAVFYNWMQMACDESNDFCEPIGFVN